MIEIIVEASELWDESNQIFINTKEQILKLEHSLVSISKWESKYHKPFLTQNEKTIEETLYYIRCMTLTQNVDPDVYLAITDKNLADINEYIANSMTATTFTDKKNVANREIVTSELIYYWMVSLNIPVEFQKWHLNRLLTLIRVCNVKNGSSKKMGRGELLERNRALNAARRKKLNSKG